MQQAHFGAILLLHIGDFYYALFDQALPVAQATGGSLAALRGYGDHRYCGIAAEGLNEAVSTLEEKGHRVVVLDGGFLLQ